ncbi:DUF6900 domain-containing protein [Thauera linaloolentis]|uniref:DUF6900 domain-containing protein n=1 Tax=Thauera linaloolentis (strain DSM 12138 / JCM 21573 / CCUG 41526 / CIP 105981 / IAM 15112 / NBRC 102519 / 47Lol) TaxID=1123367 RepID=N6YZS3_THAL4|nr:hypothetical protein [Thauera linaloolentis]ENO87663.1 hypothetical protein C666_10575 [Thauera linaloolentis 47Lol = DSM 12138]MCM8565990.1 hypothetical protein [Thauera linaloolentis]
MAKPILSPSTKREIAEIARVHLHIETLEVRGHDSLDFHSLAVWNVSAALEAAYLAGMVDHYRKRE